MFELKPPEDDGLYIPEPVGGWARDKHYFLRRYIYAFTTSMKSKRWSSLHYIDLFAGPGIVRLQDSGDLDWGSPLIAAQTPNLFDGLHFCELEPQSYEALRQRVARIRLEKEPQILHGDANEKVGDIAAKIPTGSLSLAFLDPTGLHLDFETLRVLAVNRVDLIIFFPDHLDALRNCQYVYRDDPSSNLDRVLGPGANWRAALDQAPKRQWAEVLRELYCQQIQQLGYTYFEFERICAKGHPLYLLIFCSRHELAAGLWRRVSSKKPDKQRTFDFNARA